MAKRLDWLDRALGRLVFRVFGVAFAVVAFICLHAAFRHATDWYAGSMAPAVIFGLIAVAFGSVVPYSFSRNRTLTEALDAMEGGIGDRPPPPQKG